MVEVSTSILNVEKEKIVKTIYNLETAKIDYFHIDVMDGKFVENNTTDKMMEYCGYLNNISNIPLDIHLMVENIKEYIDLFLVYIPNIITIHIEAVKKYGVKDFYRFTFSPISEIIKNDEDDENAKEKRNN